MRIAKETDQVHLGTAATCKIDDPVWNRRIIIEHSGSNSTVIWNPWIDKTKGMSDMAPDDWKEMICIETANAADNAVHLAGRVHRLAAKLRTGRSRGSPAAHGGSANVARTKAPGSAVRSQYKSIAVRVLFANKTVPRQPLLK